ncbi:tail fiber protein [Methylophilaceae phage P19250A]|nr:tail fiber protein [Methylophilaceae phage P19250A]
MSNAFNLSQLANNVDTSGILNTSGGGTGASSLASANIVTYTGAETLSNKRINPRVFSSSAPTSWTPNLASYDIYAANALNATLTINAPIGTPVDGDKLTFRILDNGSSQTLSWDGTYTQIGVNLPLTTTASKTTYVGCIYNAANTRWDVIAVTTQV